jgi:hypothetical protein
VCLCVCVCVCVCVISDVMLYGLMCLEQMYENADCSQVVESGV